MTLIKNVSYSIHSLDATVSDLSTPKASVCLKTRQRKKTWKVRPDRHNFRDSWALNFKLADVFMLKVTLSCLYSFFLQSCTCGL